MKKLLRLGILCALLVAALCVSALAATRPVEGVITDSITDVTVKYLDANGGVIAVTDATTTTLGGNTANNVYQNAKKIQITVTGAADKQCLLYAVKGDSATPTETNMIYIDQLTLTGGTATFTVVPSELKLGMSYKIYTAIEGGAGGTLVLTYHLFREYSLGAVIEPTSENPTINTLDAIQVLKKTVGKVVFDNLQMAAGDVNQDDKVNTLDAIQILKYSVGKISEF